MRIGIVSKWFASGQGVVARQLRSALCQLGHETFVLARPGRGPRAIKRGGAVDAADPAWVQPGITEAGAHEIEAGEYLEWARANRLGLVLCDENYQFEELARLRSEGVRVAGRFVWESFAPEDAEGARSAYDLVYSLTRCEQRRYATLGIESPYVRWGIHPELIAAGERRRVATGPPGDEVRLFFPCSFLGPRRPLGEVLKAFRRSPDERLRLTISAQLPRARERLRRAAARDPRIELILAEQPTDQYLSTFAAHDVLLAPSRWEGLGVPLFEATAMGLPIITNDDPPMNEIVTDGRNGLLVGSAPAGETKSGVPAVDPDVDGLAAAIMRIADPGLRAGLAAGARAVRAERSWENTVADLATILRPLGA